jgi:membrane protein DedA with SNARE-associated domain
MYDTNMWVVITMALVSALIGSTIGFVVAMRSSKKINRTVSQSQMFASFSGDSLVRKSLALNKFDYDDLGDIPEDEVMK